MGATLRIELFPWSLNTAVDFYTRVLSFELLRYEPSDKPDTGYAHLRRDAIQLGLSTKTAEEYPAAAQDPAERARFRSCPTGTELVIEVDDLEAERSKIVSQGWELESEVVMQSWGLSDFRIRDPDGYYLRISEHGEAGHRDGNSDWTMASHSVRYPSPPRFNNSKN